ncbi:beta-ketoacyl-[acyl-carrier-protein] synthase family protein [Chitinilyticum litopenaei]|uniref:beta-ketoacyl-[acyl-carrier-protein] synthase family protein n=1 Tax=Chitinilyticum litopenaei TaxID=1121276 RepID=UPI0004066204|nr:beta-ketoacyl-[acyl-carrier-protein] synthase family protein [Chitinilyticum litopenaei]
MMAYLNALGIVTPLGCGQRENLAGLIAARVALQPAPQGWLDRPAQVGAVATELPELPRELAQFESRNNRLLLAASRQIDAEIRELVVRLGAARVAVVLGSSTSGVAESEAAMPELQQGRIPDGYSYLRQEMADPARFLAELHGLKGPAYVISTACSSGARALIAARRLLRLGIADAVLCGAVDSLCRLTLNGFAALESVSATPCNPFSANRDGISIGEGAALFVMSREPAAVGLAGAGSSSDAHHISAPHPDGLGAIAAMRAALQDARLDPADITYLNLHGTATPLNDAMESRAVAAVFGEALPPASSTKALTGHTLGAAGAIEAAFCWLLLQNPHTALPVQVNDGCADETLPALNWPRQGEVYAVRAAMSNSFAFGGNNVSLILKRRDGAAS